MNRVRSVNLVFFITVCISIVGIGLNTFVSRYTDNYFILVLISQILLVLPAAAYIYMNKLNVAKVIRFNKMKLSNVILVVLFAFLIMPVMSFINAISMLFVKNEISDVAMNMVQNNGFWLSLFMMAIVPCILEESVYRGLFYNEYSKVSPLKAIFLSGFLFGVMHQNFNQFSYAFTMGVVFALLIEATNSIMATMIVHFIINGSSVLMVFLMPKLFKIMESFYGKDMYNADELMKSLQSGVQEKLTFTIILQSYGLMALIGGILAFIVYRTIAKNSNRWNYVKRIFSRKGKDERITSNSSINNGSELSAYGEGYQSEKKQHLLSISLLVGIIFCIILMFVSEFGLSNKPSKQPDNPITNSSTVMIK